MERFIRGFGLEDYIEYEDCLLDERLSTLETYSMNFFMEDEIRDNESQKRLILLFKQKGMKNGFSGTLPALSFQRFRNFSRNISVEEGLYEISVGSNGSS